MESAWLDPRHGTRARPRPGEERPDAWISWGTEKQRDGLDGCPAVQRESRANSSVRARGFAFPHIWFPTQKSRDGDRLALAQSAARPHGLVSSQGVWWVLFGVEEAAGGEDRRRVASSQPVNDGGLIRTSRFVAGGICMARSLRPLCCQLER
ncbi:hypothetical protein AAFF_G00404030 [Aldrovandia affinis]|uniref:Uncharacterized protein n=1 Tax=Aldrovandia affinis TaxID=143900 RepID=A0AAD7T7F9_9TELE|nr:hypothetical protein AAFF_G00404030 [Aldrovandia affinis]